MGRGTEPSVKDPGLALVTGGTGALGRVVAARFLRDGYRVAVTYRSSRGWKSLAEEESQAVARGDLRGFEADVTDESSVREIVARVRGGLRVVAHAAGGYAGGEPIESVSESTVRRMMDLNLVSAFWVAKHAIPPLRESGRGRLLFVSSRGAWTHDPGAGAYAAAKLGLHALVGTLARELRGSGITANAILPSIMDTDANRAAMPGARPETWVAPESVAALLSYLASDDASAVSGALIPIYGGA